MNDVGVLVSSCDCYEDLWSPFFALFFRYWPDCPYPIYLISNHRVYPSHRVHAIPVGEDRDWSSNLAMALRRIPHPRMILMMEDYLIQRAVDSGRVEDLLKVMRIQGAACLRLFPCPGPDAPCPGHPELGEIRKGAPYRLSLQAAIWDREALQDLIREGETPWEFEVNGSRRTDALDRPFLSIRRGVSPPISYFCTAVVRGKWVRGAVNLCRREGIEIDLNRRRVEPWRDSLKRRILPWIYEKISNVRKILLDNT